MENKIISNLKTAFSTAKAKWITIISGVLLLAIVLGIVVIAATNKPSEVTADSLIPTLELVGELTTAKLNFSGHKEFKDDGVLFFNRSDFLMTYQATLRAGIDIKNVEIRINDVTKTVSVTLPEAEIQEVKILPETIKYYDEGFSLFNPNTKEDANKAQKQAEDAAKIEAVETGILDFANNHAKTLLQKLLQDALPEEYTIEIK